MFKKYPLYKKILCLLDLIMIAIAAYTAISLERWYGIKRNYSEIASWNNFIFLFFVSFIYIYFFHENQLYKLNIIITKNKQLVLLTRSLFYGIPIFLMASFFMKVTLIKYMRPALMLFFPILFISFAFERLILIRKLYKKMVRKGYWKRNALIIGAGEAGQMVAAQIEMNSDLGFHIAGFVDDDPNKQEMKIFDKPVLGKVSDIDKDMLARNNIQLILIAINSITHGRLFDMIRYCKRFNLPISLVSRHFDIIAETLDISQFSRLSDVTLNTSGSINLLYFVFKRIFDITISVTLLLLFMPFFLVLAVAIKLDSPGPIFYKTKVIGKGARQFTWYKFRSMVAKSDDALHREHLKKIILGEVKNGEKLKNDYRITRVGQFIRKYSIDELPQLYNVLKGDMALVGPRPCLPYEYEYYKKWQKSRFSIVPGLTGLWQVYGRNKVNYDDLVIIDLYYIRNRSIWMDYFILLKTIPIVLFGKGGV